MTAAGFTLLPLSSILACVDDGLETVGVDAGLEAIEDNIECVAHFAGVARRNAPEGRVVPPFGAENTVCVLYLHAIGTLPKFAPRLNCRRGGMIRW